MEKHSTYKVFTPTSPAQSSFIERGKKLNSHLVDALRTPGKQIVIYGHSGTGKTTLIVNKLNQVYENHVITRCMDGMTFENLIIEAFDELDEYFVSSQTTSSGLQIAPKISLSYQEIKSSISLIEINKGKSKSQQRLLPPQLTAKRLGTFFGASNTCWILEDFHKIKGDEKTRAAQLMKVFMDMSMDFENLKVIAIGAVGSAREVVQYDKEMNNRITEIYVPYMQPAEILKIIERGEKLLNVRFTKELKNKIIQYSCGLPSICHQLCLNMCINNIIHETSEDIYYFKQGDLDEAIEKFVEEKSDTLKAAYDQAVKVKNNTKENIPKEVLRAALKINRDEFAFDEIRMHYKNSKTASQKIENALNELCTFDRGEFFSYDENSNKYRFNNLFLKNYALIQLTDEDNEIDSAVTVREEKIIRRLLDIIEKEIHDEYDIFIEEM